MKKKIIMGVIALVLIGVSVGATLFLTGGSKPAEVAAEGDPAAAPPPPAAAALPVVPAPMEVFYYNIHPEFVVNFKGNSKLRFLMLEISVSLFEEKATAVIDDHTPELRNNLLMLLGEQDAEVLKTTEGKEALRESVHEIIEGVVSKHYGPQRVADVFFTRFVMQ